MTDSLHEVLWGGKTKPILQGEAAECGLACLAMVANAHDHDVDLTALRRAYPMSLKGMTLRDVIAIASSLGFSTRAVRLDLDELEQLQLPAILHWDLNHFVVLERIDRQSVTILDPARGRRQLSFNKLSRHFTGVALEVEPSASFTPVVLRSRVRLRDLWSRMTRVRKAAFEILILSVVAQIAVVLVPFYVQLVIDQAIAQADSGLLTLLFAAFAMILALQAGIRALRNWVSLSFGQSLSFHLTGNIVRHLLRLPVDFFERRHIGDVMSRIGAVQPIQQLLSQGFINALIDGCLIVVTLGVMLVVSPALSLVVVGGCLAYLLVARILQPQLQHRTEEEIVARAEEATYLMESIRSIRAVKLHTQEAQRENGWRNRFANVVSASYQRGLVDVKAGLAEELTLHASFLLTVFLGARQVMDGSLSVGALVAFLSYRTSFTQSAVGLIYQFRQWKLLSVHLERLADIVTEAREDVRPAIGRSSPRNPDIEVEGLSFRYSPHDPLVLEGLSFRIPAGSMVAVIGPSGVGKSTLIRILLGLAPASGGTIRIDGQPLNNSNLAQWRGRIGAVMQDDCLLSGSIAENISFFDGQPKRERIEHVAQLARIHEDISAMPMGYESLVSDMGSALSAGQRQRILLARALYRRPDILFLDEGTANLDEENETQIANLIQALPITRVVIAHRPALIQRADFILHLTRDGAQLLRNVQKPEPAGQALETA